MPPLSCVLQSETDTVDKIKVYGADWCPMTISAKRHLDSLGVAYVYIDVDDDPQASAWVKQHNAGKEKKPTFDIDGEVLTAPSRAVVEQKLRAKQLLD
jgi:glutaredoxin